MAVPITKFSRNEILSKLLTGGVITRNEAREKLFDEPSLAAGREISYNAGRFVNSALAGVNPHSSSNAMDVVLGAPVDNPQCECHLAHERKTNYCPIHQPIVAPGTTSSAFTWMPNAVYAIDDKIMVMDEAQIKMEETFADWNELRSQIATGFKLPADSLNNQTFSTVTAATAQIEQANQDSQDYFEQMKEAIAEWFSVKSAKDAVAAKPAKPAEEPVVVAVVELCTNRRLIIE